MIWDWVNLYHMYLFRLILQAKSFVLFYLWYSSCFEVKCWIHTFPKRCSHIAIWILILLDHRGCHVNSFPTGAFLFKWIRSFSTSARSTLSFLKGVCFIRPKLSLFFPPSHPYFFKDSDFWIKYHFIDRKSLHSCLSMFYPVVLMKMFFKFIIIRSLSSPVD